LIKTITFISTLFLTGCAHMSVPYVGGDCPLAHSVKGNADSGIYHTMDSPYYDTTRAEVCFSDRHEARKMGYRPATF